jgi:hypothetical protein
VRADGVPGVFVEDDGRAVGEMGSGHRLIHLRALKLGTTGRMAWMARFCSSEKRV